MARPRRPQTFPWEIGHATPQDRAMGLELELIELGRRRQAVLVGDPEALRLDGEIDRTSAELDALVEGFAVAV